MGNGRQLKEMDLNLHSRVRGGLPKGGWNVIFWRSGGSMPNISGTSYRSSMELDFINLSAATWASVEQWVRLKFIELKIFNCLVITVEGFHIRSYEPFHRTIYTMDPIWGRKKVSHQFEQRRWGGTAKSEILREKILTLRRVKKNETFSRN